MKRTWMTILLILLTAGCTPLPAEVQTRVPLGTGALFLEAENASITVETADDDQPLLIYSLPADAENTPIIEEDPAKTLIRFSQPRKFLKKAADPKIILQVPPNTNLNITTFFGDITLTNLGGEIEVRSTGANIQADNVSGNILLKSGRGDVTVSHSTGDLVILGEHGRLSINDSHGNIALATIMGTISFSGLLSPADRIFLETDHGPVFATLKTPVHADIYVHTASGKIACMLPNLTAMPDGGCKGTVGGESAAGFEVKTVSGDVKIEAKP